MTELTKQYAYNTRKNLRVNVTLPLITAAARDSPTPVSMSLDSARQSGRGPAANRSMPSGRPAKIISDTAGHTLSLALERLAEDQPVPPSAELARLAADASRGPRGAAMRGKARALTSGDDDATAVLSGEIRCSCAGCR
jgi:hypothetical protein